MRFIRYAIYAIIFIILVTLAVTNGQRVELTVLPNWFPLFGEKKVNWPLFSYIYIALFAGLLLGYLFEYLRSFGIRRKASKSNSALKRTERELEELKKEAGKHDDDVLAILE